MDMNYKNLQKREYLSNKPMLIFDLDGTLWDTTDTTYEATNIVVSKHQELKHVDIQTIKRGMGLSKYENAKNYFPYLKENEALKYVEEKSAVNVKLIKEKGTYIYDGVVDTIKELSKKYKLAIVTNSNDKYAQMFLEVAKLGDYFTDYIGASTYSITKAEAIRKLVERNNEPDSFYIGDIKKDMDAALEAGIKFIHARYGFEKNVDSKYYIDDIRDLMKLMNNM